MNPIDEREGVVTPRVFYFIGKVLREVLQQEAEGAEPAAIPISSQR